MDKSIRSTPWPTYDKDNVFVDDEDLGAPRQALENRPYFRYDYRQYGDTETGRFEAALRRYLSVEHALAVSSGTAAIAGARRLAPGPDPVSSLLAACEQVEQMGGSADGIVMNPADYFRYLVPRQDVVTGLAGLGIRIARTRMVGAGTIVVGDFFAGATLHDSGRSTIGFGRPPDGTFARDGLAVQGEIRTALAIHLPTHFFIAALA